MTTSLSTLASKVVNRLRSQGPRIAILYYFGVLKYWTHYFIYDRWCDRLERRRSSGNMFVPKHDLIGSTVNLQVPQYQAFPRLLLLWSIRALGIDPADYTFIDYGSGRGRMLLTAARLPFKRVIGVEFSRTLHNEATENIAHHPKDKLACRDIASLNINAVEFDLPAGNIIAFFYNPFTGEVLDQVARRIEDAWRASPHSVHVIFANSHRVPLFTDRPSFKRFKPGVLERLRLAAMGNVPIEFFSLTSPSRR